MSEDPLHDARVEGSRAFILMQNEQFQNAINAIKQAYSDKLFATPVDQPQQREILYNAYRIIPEIISHLQYVIDNGKLADAELQRLIRLQETKKSWSAV